MFNRGAICRRAANRLRQHGVQAGQCRGEGPCPLGHAPRWEFLQPLAAQSKGVAVQQGSRQSLCQGVHRSGPCSYFNILLPCNQGATVHGKLLQAAHAAAQLCPRPPVLLWHHSSLLFASVMWLQHFEGLAQVLGEAHYTGRSPSVKACEIHTL